LASEPEIYFHGDTPNFPIILGAETMNEFEECWRYALEAGVLLARPEAERLFQYVQRFPTNVVEVGSFTGGSACILAACARRLTLIDPDGRFAPTILANLARTPWFHRVSIVTLQDSLVWPHYPGKISLLFLDHEHTWAAVRNSLHGWRHVLAADSIIACHDYNPRKFPDVKRAIDESGIHIIETCGAMVFCSWDSPLNPTVQEVTA
jgi:predicted O-methyltransferase YrrM